MASLISKASLLMVPSVYEDGTLYNVLPSGNKAPDETGSHNAYDQTRADFTFSRGSNLAATRRNSSGLIEKGRENLLLQSNNFGTTWLTTSASVTSGQSGYDGSSNAWLLNESAVGGRIRQTISGSGVMTMSLYAKSGSLDYLLIYVNTTSSDPYAYFDLATGVLGNTSQTIDAKIEDVGNGWYRCSVTGNIGTLSAIEIYPANSTSNHTTTAGSVYIQSAQLEKGLVSTPYIETGATTATAGVLENTPRIDYSSGAGALLLEPQRTNLLPHSEYINGWGIKSGVTATTNTITSPDGLQNASTIAATTSSTNYIGDYYTFSASTKYTYSVFVKNNTSTKMRLQVYDSSQYATLDFDQSDSVLYSANLDSYDFVDYGNGWRRVIISFTTSSGAGSGYVQIYPDRNGNNHSMYIFGAQLEAGSHVSSYVPTYGSAATRGADGHLQLTDIINKGIGTSGGYSVLFELDQNENPSGSNSGVLFIGKDANMSSIELSVTSYEATEAGRMRIVSATDGTVEYLDSPNTRKYAFSVNGTSVIWADETESGTDTISVSANSIGSIKAQYGTSERTISFWKQLIVVPEVLTAQEMQDWCS